MMKVLFVAACLVAVSLAKSLVNDQAIVDHVNSLQTTWTAKQQYYFQNWTVAEAAASMGVKAPTSFPPMIDYSNVGTQMPASFDARTKWPSCIGPILNQAKCGSCWAFGATEAISDRLCISGNTASGKFLQLGPLDLTTCGGQGGCEGGELYGAWLWAQYEGLATETCLPYNEPLGPIQPCAGSPSNPLDNPCTDFQTTPQCTQACNPKTAVNNETYTSSKHFVKSVYGVGSEQDIMNEIFANGPIESAFTVYADFVHYETGVYSHQTGAALGGHAIKIIGWGVENNQKYWLVQNSWTTQWAGLGGYFKILKGVNECGIEAAGMAGAV